MVYIVYDPDNIKGYYREVSEAEYALVILSGEWKERGHLCTSIGCKTCGGDGNNKTLMRIQDAV